MARAHGVLLTIGWLMFAPVFAGAQTASGVVSGVVLDGNTGAVIRGAEVELVGAEVSVRTDLDGKFVLTAPAGTYRLRVTSPGYFPNDLDVFEIAAGGQRVVDLVLIEERVATGGTITVTGAAPTIEASTEAAMILERRSAPSVADLIGAQEISSSGDSDAAGVMARVVGVSVLDDKYVYVRGLGDRFSTTQLNGSLLPSTEADKKVVPLDLFPANLVDNIRLQKTFTPDMPAEFAGALVRIETVEFPLAPTLRFSVSQGFNSLTTFKDFRGYPGGRYDWLGFGDRRRQIPAAIPPERLIRRGLFSQTGFTPAELEGFGESFENVWNPRIDQAIPNQSFSLQAGATWGPIGVIYGLAYGNKFQNSETARNYYRIGNNEITPKHQYVLEASSNSVRLGNTLNFAYKLHDNHKLLFRNFYSKDASDETRLMTGYNDDFATDVRNQRLRFIEEGIYSGQLAGEHFFTGLNGLAEWRLAYSRADRDEPDIREALYIFNTATGTFRFREQSQSGSRQFIESTDKIWEPGVDFTKFFTAGRTAGSFKFGGVWTERDRYFNSRRFRFRPLNVAGLDLAQDPETLFTPAYIGPNFEIQEDTRATDHYLAEHEIRAAYVMADVYLNARWRIIGGLRREDSTQVLNSFDLFAVNPTVIETRLADVDYLPGVNVIYALRPQQNIRVAYSKTLARPNFRELAPFDFTDVTGGATVVGNPELTRSRIDNFDLRWEYFPSATELVSASLFYKQFADPIEQILEPTAQIRQSFANVNGAHNWGVETEVRKGLGGIRAALSNFTVSANYTFVSSEVDIGDRALSVLTSTQRPLAGQSSNVFNGAVEYGNPGWWRHTSRLMYNMVGRRIVGVGAAGLPDIFQERQSILDLVVQQSFSETSPLELKFSANNLLDDEKRYTQGGLPYEVFREGRTYSVGLSYRFR